MCISVNRSTCEKIATHICQYTYSVYPIPMSFQANKSSIARKWTNNEAVSFELKHPSIRHQYGLVNSDDDLVFFLEKMGFFKCCIHV